ncbi:hypothetical protein [uncultured Roseobacter sp.]|uniref:hypothetical protein n=1 Tax=uncultured Roseobacter sp. TaxID=114847 RepID=UPI0026316956|nr:hypothetical protein [uncultured Roseobacter sp.]
MNGFDDKGWCVFPPEPAVLDWVRYAAADAARALADPAQAPQYQCGGTWFVGLDALGNDAQGRVRGSGPLTGRAVDFLTSGTGFWPALHRAQVSVTFPGYPLPREGETEAGFRYRKNRDAAHVDGLIGRGTPRRRFVEEPHAFVLGIPLNHADAGAAPLVVWEGSHHMMQTAFAGAFSGQAPEKLAALDVTEVYQDTRRRAFDSCRRTVITAPPGSAIVLHRLLLHGVAPWAEGAQAEDDRRMIAYFRPEISGGPAAWVAPGA